MVRSAAASLSRWPAIGLALALAAYVLSFFHRVAPAAIAPDLQAVFHVSGAQLGNLAATYFYVYTLMQVPTGILVDTVGPRRILFFGGLLAAAGSLVFGLATDFSGVLLGRGLAGLGVSVAFIALLKLIATGFAENRFATLVGLGMLLGNLGSILAGAPLSLAAAAIGWRSVFVFVAAVSLAIAVLSLLCIPESPTRQSDRTPWLAGLLQVMRNRATWPGFFVNLGIAGSFFAFGGLWAVPFLIQARGLSHASAALHVSVCFLGLAVGSAIWGRVSDRLGQRRRPMVAVAAGYALSWTALLQVASPAPALLLALCATLGLFAASFSLSWACAKEVNSPLHSGMATSIVNVGCFLGAGILQPAVGWMLDRQWDGSLQAGAPHYGQAGFSSGMMLFLGAAWAGFIATLFVRETGCRNLSDSLP